MNSTERICGFPRFPEESDSESLLKNGGVDVNEYFKGIFNEIPFEIINDDYYFNADKDGDSFDESDADLWLKEVFRNRWNSAIQTDNELFQYFYADVLQAYYKIKSPFLEIACGPGMGLAPVILSKFPQAPCLATDACSLLIKSWRKYIDESLNQYDISLASFSALKIPIKSNSVDAVTSFIGISSTRAGERGKEQALREIFRILKNDGYFIAIENEWTDFNAIEEVFRLWNKPMWSGMKKEKPWPERFCDCGFSIESYGKSFYRFLRNDDNDLGEQADKFGIKISIKFTLYILRKQS